MGQTITFKRPDGQSVQGYLAEPGAGSAPGVVHSAAAIEPAGGPVLQIKRQSFADISAQVTMPATPRPRYCSASS